MWKIGALIVVVLGLGACSEPSNAYDYAKNDVPGIKVDRVKANVGDPVIVTLTSGFELTERSRRAEDTIQNLFLGACIDSEKLALEGGLCDLEDTPMPKAFQLLDNTTYAKSYGDLVIKRGEYQKLEHTFVFTSTEPGEVEISSIIRVFYEKEYETPSLSVGVGEVITFEQ